MTAVREQPAEPERHRYQLGPGMRCSLCGQKVQDAIHLSIEEDRPGEPERKLIGPARAHLDAPCTDACYEPAEPEPQQADVSPVLDLVRQYGELSAAAALYPKSSAPAQADALLARIPLLVGGDPAPEAARDHDAARAWAHVLKARGDYEAARAKLLEVVTERDEARVTAKHNLEWAIRLNAEVERLAVELTVEREAEERGNAELKDIVRRLDEAEVDSGGASERVGYAIQSMQRGWATATNNLALLDTVKSDRETIRGSLNYLKDTVTGRAIELLGVEHNEDIVPAIERLKAAQPDPLVLSLPEGAVALIGGRSGRRFTRVDREGPKDWWNAEDGRQSLGSVMDLEGTVRVELAPPRTWPALKPGPAPVDLPQYVTVEGWGSYGRREDGLYANTDGYPDDVWRGHCLTFAALRALGDVTEVTE